MPFEGPRARAVRKAREAKAKLHQQSAAAASQQSESDSDESVSEPPSKSARVDDDTGASSCSEHLVCDASIYHYIYYLTLTADDMTVLHVGAMAEVCGLVNHWTHNGDWYQIWRLQGRLAETSHA